MTAGVVNCQQQWQGRRGRSAELHSAHSLGAEQIRARMRNTRALAQKRLPPAATLWLRQPFFIGYSLSGLSERSSAWLEHLVWDQDVAGSNPVAPTIPHTTSWRTPSLRPEVGPHSSSSRLRVLAVMHSHRTTAKSRRREEGDGAKGKKKRNRLSKSRLKTPRAGDRVVAFHCLALPGPSGPSGPLRGQIHLTQRIRQYRGPGVHPNAQFRGHWEQEPPWFLCADWKSAVQQSATRATLRYQGTVPGSGFGFPPI